MTQINPKATVTKVRIALDGTAISKAVRQKAKCRTKIHFVKGF